jgi:hypothetical protein
LREASRKRKQVTSIKVRIVMALREGMAIADRGIRLKSGPNTCFLRSPMPMMVRAGEVRKRCGGYGNVDDVLRAQGRDNCMWDIQGREVICDGESKGFMVIRVATWSGVPGLLPMGMRSGGGKGIG